MDKQQQEQQVELDELSDEIYEAIVEFNGKSFKEIGYELLQEFIAQHLISKGWRKAGELTEFNKDLLDTVKKQDEISKYWLWQWGLIRIIANSKAPDAVIREEIKCVMRNERQYKEAFNNGETPEQYWQGELEAIRDSQ